MRAGSSVRLSLKKVRILRQTPLPVLPQTGAADQMPLLKNLQRFT
jgi:hypothetical protein